jgi:hypothetical protein
LPFWADMEGSMTGEMVSGEFRPPRVARVGGYTRRETVKS